MASSSPSTSGPPQSTVQAPPLLPQPLDQAALQQLHVHVPPLPSPNTTAAAAALFRVNQLPMAVLSPSPTGPFSFDKADLQRTGRRSRRDEHVDCDERGAVDRHNSEDGTRAVEGTDDGFHTLHRDRIAEHSSSVEENEERAENRSGFDDSTSPLLPLSLYAPPAGGSSSGVGAAGGGLTAAGLTKSAENVLHHSELPMSPPSGDVRKRNVGVPKFLRFLFQMLEYEDRSVICWSHKGTAFQIRQPEVLARNVLPKYFKHNKVSSFQRQLNYFGFKKWTKTQTNICTFSHPHFIRGEKEKMRLIKRKERSSRTSSDDAKGDAIAVATNEVLAEDDGSDGARGRETAEPEPDRTDSTRVSAKRPRTAAASSGRSPRGESSRAKGATRGTVKKEPAVRRTQSATVKKRGKAAAAVTAASHDPPTSMAKILLPAISPSSSSSSAWVSSSSATAGDSGRVGGAGDAYGRFVRETAPSSHASYPMVDAAPVMPIHSSLLMSHQQQSQQSMARRLTGGGYDGMSMNDFVSANWSPPQQQAAEDSDHCPSAAKDSMMMLSAFKYGDSSSLSAAIGLQPSAFDMMEAQSHSYGGQSQTSSHAAGSSSSSAAGGSKDYLDMLLESATMDEQLSVAAASAAAASDGTLGSAWDTSYASSSSQHAQHSYHHQSHHDSHSSMHHGSGVASSSTSSSSTQPLPSLEDLHSGRY